MLDSLPDVVSKKAQALVGVLTSSIQLSIRSGMRFVLIGETSHGSERDLPTEMQLISRYFYARFAASIRCDPAFRSHSRGRIAGTHSRMGTGEVEERFRLPVMSALRLFFWIQVVVAMTVLAQTPSGQTSSLPSQAKEVHGLAVPVPKEIFRSLDQFRDANWVAVKRPEIARWKSHGDQAQIATLLGVVIAEGFIAMEAKDSAEVENLGKSVLSLAGGLGIRQRAVRRSRSIMELAEKDEWPEARKEWDRVLSDLETGMIEIKSEQLAQLVSLGGWLRGTEALSALVLQKYSPERASLIRQPALIDYLEKQLRAMRSDIRARPIVVKLLDRIQTIRSLVESETGPPSEETVRKIHGVCAELVPLASQRLE